MYRRGGWTVSRRTLPSAAEEAIGINTRSGKEEAEGGGAPLLCLLSQRLLQIFSEAWQKLRNCSSPPQCLPAIGMLLQLQLP